MEAKGKRESLTRRFKGLFRHSSAETSQTIDTNEATTRAESLAENHVEDHVEPPPPEIPPPAVPSRLETLPSELGAQILASLCDLDDLKAAVHASPVLYKQYRENRKSVLYKVLQSTLGDRILVDAYAVQTSAPLEHPPYLPPQLAVQVHMSTYQEHCCNPSAIFSDCTVEELIGMAAFYRFTIKRLLAFIHEKFLRNLDRSLKVGDHRGGLSLVEWMRIVRALYRFQLWCNLYGTREGAACRDLTVDPYDMLMYFFEVFQPWEIEEISCLHALFTDRYDLIFASIRWDLHEHSIRFADPSPRETPNGSVDLGHGPEDDSEHRGALLDGVVSRGLEFHLRTMQVKNHEQLVTAMETTIQTGHNSIRDALSISTQRMRRLMDPSERDKPHRIRFTRDHEDEPPKAWVKLWSGRTRNYVGGMLPFSLKRWGYVFWDGKRLERSRGVDVVRRARRSVEASLLEPEDSD